MNDLMIDAEEFARARTVLRRVIDEFDRTDRVTYDTAEYTGHHGLRSTVQHFADGWDIGRGKLRDNLAFLSEAIESILETFADLDGELAGSIQGSTGSLAPEEPSRPAGPESDGSPVPGGSSAGGPAVGGPTIGGGQSPSAPPPQGGPYSDSAGGRPTEQSELEGIASTMPVPINDGPPDLDQLRPMPPIGSFPIEPPQQYPVAEPGLAPEVPGQEGAPQPGGDADPGAGTAAEATAQAGSSSATGGPDAAAVPRDPSGVPSSEATLGATTSSGVDSADSLLPSADGAAGSADSLSPSGEATAFAPDEEPASASHAIDDDSTPQTTASDVARGVAVGAAIAAGGAALGVTGVAAQAASRSAKGPSESRRTA